MGYPFTISWNGDTFARTNFDGSWSVDWEKTLKARFQPLTTRNSRIIACAVVLLAAKDNFFVTPWSRSDELVNKWEHKCLDIDILPDDPDPGTFPFNVAQHEDEAARVNVDGSWSVKWDLVETISRLPKNNWRTLAISAFCDLLMAGQYNFPVFPWKDEIETDGED